MADRVVHVAGMPIRVGYQLRQRCAWCGALLLEYDLANTASPDPKATISTWSMDTLVAVESSGGRTGSWHVEQSKDEPLPRNCCASPQFGKPPVRLVKEDT